MDAVELDGQKIAIQNIFCIGRNYDEHIKELNNARPSEPMVFLKPSSAILLEDQAIVLPAYSQNVHYECEVVVLIKEDMNHVAEEDALDYVAGFGIGLDLTARDVQDEAKAKGLPWLKCKGFRGAACVSNFIARDLVSDVNGLTFSLSINDEIKQLGRTEHMIYPVASLLSHLSKVYGLRKGDLVYTGTPAGVGELHAGDHLALDLHGQVRAKFKVAA